MNNQQYEAPLPPNTLRNADGTPYQAGYDASMSKQELIELLADKEHASWSHWMNYLFSKCTFTMHGDAVIPMELALRWKIQANTPYEQLSEREKQSDRDEVAHILPIIEDYASQEDLRKGVMTINEARERIKLPLHGITYRGLSMQELDERIDFYRMHRGGK